MYTMWKCSKEENLLPSRKAPIPVPSLMEFPEREKLFLDSK